MEQELSPFELIDDLLEQDRELKELRERLSVFENRKTALRDRMSTLTLENWNRRLSARGAMLESCIPGPEDWEDEQLEALLGQIFSLEEVREIVERFALEA